MPRSEIPSFPIRTVERPVDIKTTSPGCSRQEPVITPPPLDIPDASQDLGVEQPGAGIGSSVCRRWSTCEGRVQEMSVPVCNWCRTWALSDDILTYETA